MSLLPRESSSRVSRRGHLLRMSRGRSDVIATHLAAPIAANLPMPTFVQLQA